MQWKTVVISVVIVAGACTVLVYGFAGRSASVVQPVLFNHAVHVGGASLACLDCHSDAEKHTHAGLPGKSTCAGCHEMDNERGSNPEKDKLFAYYPNTGDLPWVRVAVTRPDVFFSHRRHAGVAKIDCLECHPGQPSLSAPPAKTQLVMRMNTCLECHRKNGVSVDCLACHR